MYHFKEKCKKTGNGHEAGGKDFILGSLKAF